MRSNGLFSFGVAFLFGVITLTSGCSLLSSKNDDCDATKMTKTEEPLIYLRLYVDPDVMNTQVGTYYLKNAEKMEVIGSVEKIYCSGKQSGKFTFSPSFFPIQLTMVEISLGLFLPQPYQYKFDNFKDKLIVTYNLKARFSDGKIFETDIFIEEFFYSDLTYEVNNARYYFKVGHSFSPYPWRQVTSK